MLLMIDVANHHQKYNHNVLDIIIFVTKDVKWLLLYEYLKKLPAEAADTSCAALNTDCSYGILML